MKKTRKRPKPISAKAVARLADQGKDVTGYFKGEGRMVQPMQRVNVGPNGSNARGVGQGRPGTQR